MIKRIEAEISFAEMVDALKNTTGEVESPVSIFDNNTLFSAERYAEITRMISSISSLRRNEAVDLSVNSHTRSKIIASISIDSLWFSIPILAKSDIEMQEAFFEKVTPKTWNGLGEVSVKTKFYGTSEKLPVIHFLIGKDEMEIGITKDRDGYSLYASRGHNLPLKDASSFITLSDLQNFIYMLENIFSPGISMQIDQTREDAEKRISRIERIDVKMAFCLDNVQKTKISQVNLKKGMTMLSFH